MAAPHLCRRSRINKGAVRGKMEFGSARLILFYCVSLARSLELAAHCSGVWCFPPHRWLHVVWLSGLLHFHVHSASTLVFLASTKANCSSFFPGFIPPLCLFIISPRLLLSFFHNNENHLFCLFTLPPLCPKWDSCHCRPRSVHTFRKRECGGAGTGAAAWPPPTCSNLIFTFDLVKRLYLEYMSLFKFMRSGRVLSVIGIIYALSWGGSVCSFSTITGYVNVGVAAARTHIEGTHVHPSTESDMEYCVKMLIGHL